MIVKIEFKGKTKLGSLLSHLAYTPFVVDTCYTSSFEGFRQGLRFQADDDNRGQPSVTSVGRLASWR